jgi:PAS domain S-box-containing protein
MRSRRMPSLYAVAVVFDFLPGSSLGYAKMTGVRTIETFGGASYRVAEGVPNPLNALTYLGVFMLLVFVVDASVRLARRGERRRAVVIGGSVAFWVFAAGAHSALIEIGVLRMPYLVSLTYLAILLAMAYELTTDVSAAAQVGRQLQESERRMDLAASAAELGVWVWNIATNEIWISEKGRALFGFAPSAKLDIDRFRNAIHPDDRDSMRRAVENSLSTGTEYEAEHRVLLPDGEVRWLAERGRVEFETKGKPVRMRGVSFDVTRRKLGEEALSESEARFRTVANTAPVMIWMSGVDKLCTFFNKPWLEFTGRTVEQEMGNGWAEGVHPDDLQRCLKIFTEAFDARQPFVMRYRLRRHDGEYRWISDHGVPRYDAQKNFAGYIGSCVDVTELINKEEALREFEERVVLAAQAAHLGVWEMDTATNEIWMSDSAVSLFQFDPDTRLNHAVLQDRVHPEDRSLRDAAVKDAIETRGEYEIEYRVVLPDGTVRWIGARGRCVAGKNGKGPRLIGVSIDITPRKLAEAEAARNREELGHLSRVAAMGELAASIAHELNQPLSGITINASTAQRLIDHGDVDLGELRDVLSDIVADGRRAGEVIRGIQHMVKKGRPGRQRVDLNDVVTNVARMVNPNAILRSCNLETLLEPNLPDIEANPVQLQQVLLNLIINAFDAVQDTPVGRRKVVVATERNGDGTIRTSVRDYGTGIPEEMRERVFEQFFTTKANGVGMGLAIARSIVKSHGGSIAVENVDGGGACFHLTFPASPSGRLPV